VVDEQVLIGADMKDRHIIKSIKSENKKVYEKLTDYIANYDATRDASDDMIKL
jgi:hypothetical protein